MDGGERTGGEEVGGQEHGRETMPMPRGEESQEKKATGRETEMGRRDGEVHFRG